MKMKTKYILLILFLIPFLGKAYGQVAKTPNQTYVGTYKTADQKSCPVSLTITAGKDGYHYKFIIKSKVKEGLIKISKQDSEVYLTFKGLYQKMPKKYEVEAQYIDHNVVFQNDGNAMNRFNVFGECNEDKYIELKKVGKR